MPVVDLIFIAMNKEEATEMFVQMLMADTDLTEMLQGRIYNRKRSDGRETEECIVVNTPWVNHRRPQSGYTNINIHVPGETHTIDGVQQIQPNTERMGNLTNIVLSLLDNAEYPNGFSCSSMQENAMVEDVRSEDYNNIRIDWINGNN